MTEYDDRDDESNDSQLRFDRRSPHTVRGQSEPMPTGSAFFTSSYGFDEPEITVDGWYTEEEGREEHQISREEVTIQLSAVSGPEEFSVTTSVEPDRARDLADALLEAAEIADGKYSDREERTGGE